MPLEHYAILSPVFTTLDHKGFALPSLEWKGHEAAVKQADALSRRLSQTHRRRMTSDHLDAIDAMHDFCKEMGLTPSDAERVIFVSRLLGDIVDDELATLKRTGHGNARIEAEKP